MRDRCPNCKFDHGGKHLDPETIRTLDQDESILVTCWNCEREYPFQSKTWLENMEQ